MSQSNQRGGLSFDLSEPAPSVQKSASAPLGDLELDLGAFTAPHDPASSAPTPAPQQAVSSSFFDLQEASPTPAEQPGAFDEKPESVRIESPFSPLPPRGNRKTEQPLVKKISFPATARSEQPPLKTQFSPSVGRVQPRPDSEPPPDFNDEKSLPASHPPKDPAEGADIWSALRSHSDEVPTVSSSDWQPDTPGAAEIWRNAREVWNKTSRQAAHLSGRGLSASKRLARDLNHRVKERSAARRISTTAPGPAPGSGEKRGQTTLPQPASSPVSGWMPRVALHAAKKLVAPLSAVSAAALVYFAGSQVLGVDAQLALSRAVQAPAVPDLGSLDSDREKAAPQQQATASRDKKPPGRLVPQKMQTEVTPMPDGLSWPGKGLVEVVTSEAELIYVDGVFTGRGPLRRVPVSPGSHEIEIRSGGQVRSGTVEVTTNKNTRAVFAKK